MTKVLIAETGIPPGDLAARFDNYAGMTAAMLTGVSDGFSFETIQIFAGDRVPAPREDTALFITGSPAGVYEGHDWIAPLEDSVREWAAADRPIVGICFGHQLMAQAFGGRVEKSPKGWGVGVHTYDMAVRSAPWGALPRRFSCAVSHQDQVMERPAGALRLAGSPFCPNGVLLYGEGRSLSFQMHPEFDHAFASALLSTRHDRMPEDVWTLAQSTYDNPTDRADMARWIATFLLGDTL